MLLKERDGDSAQVMVTAIRALATQRRPSEGRIPGLLSGLTTIAERMTEAAPVFAAAGE
jgi:hypothetical protein